MVSKSNQTEAECYKSQDTGLDWISLPKVNYDALIPRHLL